MRLFFISSFAVVLIACYYSINSPTGRVWYSHIEAGRAFLLGNIPELPAYPMWGYSILAGLLGKNILILQAFLLLTILFYWYNSLRKYIPSHTNKFQLILLNPFVIVSILIPWIFLSLSYYSNSMGELLLFVGIWLLILAEKNNYEIKYYCLSGFFLGLSVNIRSEYLLFVLFLLVSLFINGFLKKNILFTFFRTLLFALVVFSTLIPWFIYTNNAVGRPILGSTNGGAVAYLGLGLVPNNPWYIIPDDSFVAKLSANELKKSPWSYEANIHFYQAYFHSIKEYPFSFFKRILFGWKLFFFQGVYSPDIRNLQHWNNQDVKVHEYLHQSFKEKLNLSSKSKLKIEKLKREGVNPDKITIMHYFVISIDYIIKIFYLSIFLILLVVSSYLIFSRRSSRFVSLIFYSFISYLFFTAGLIQSSPRHSTAILPILLITLLLTTKGTKETAVT